jgi:hypothetical protein
LIDTVTGNIEVEGDPEGLGPALRLSAFLATPLGRAAKLVVRNEPWRTLHIAACRIGGAEFAAMLIFEGERLATVTLCLADPANALSYEALDAGHRRWVAANLRGGKPWRTEESERRFAWGTLWVGFDVKSGGPEIVVSYR